MRTSRLRLADIFFLFRLKYPVRCRTCFHRDYASIFTAWKLPRHRQLFLLGEYAAAASLPDLNKHRESLDQRRNRRFIASANHRSSSKQLLRSDRSRTITSGFILQK
jgi:hypothetical protein